MTLSLYVKARKQLKTLIPLIEERSNNLQCNIQEKNKTHTPSIDHLSSPTKQLLHFSMNVNFKRTLGKEMCVAR